VLQTGDARFPAPDANTLYAFYFPAGVTITTGANVSTGDGGVDGGDDGGDDGGTIDAGFGGGVSSSCLDFGGYHDNIQLDAAHNNLNVAYAVIPRCRASGRSRVSTRSPAPRATNTWRRSPIRSRIPRP